MMKNIMTVNSEWRSSFGLWLAIVLLVLADTSWAKAQGVSQNSRGNCSPNISAGGSVSGVTVVCPPSGRPAGEETIEEIAQCCVAYCLTIKCNSPPLQKG